MGWHNKKIAVITYTPFWLKSNGCQQRINGLLELLQQAKIKIDLIFVEQQKLLTKTDRRVLKQQNRFDSVHKVRLTKKDLLIKHWLKQMLPRQVVTLLESRNLAGTTGTASNDISSTGHFERMVNGYVRKKVQHILKKLDPDAIIVEYADLGYVLDRLELPCLKIVDTHDALHMQDNSLSRAGLEKSYLVTLEEERTALERFDVIIAIQEQERELFQKLCPGKKVITLLPWIPVKAVPAKADSETNILFLGFNNKANIHGIKIFLAEVWPLILHCLPKAKLLIGGKISGEIVASQYKNVEFLGFFKDLDDFYSLGEITVNPVVAGSGLKIKTLEALTMGKICIASSHSAEGLNSFIGHGLAVADTNEEYVSLITKYMTDSKLRKTKIEEALNIARQSISAENCIQPLLNELS